MLRFTDLVVIVTVSVVSLVFKRMESQQHGAIGLGIVHPEIPAVWRFTRLVGFSPGHHLQRPDGVWSPFYGTFFGGQISVTVSRKNLTLFLETKYRPFRCRNDPKPATNGTICTRKKRKSHGHAAKKQTTDLSLENLLGRERHGRDGVVISCSNCLVDE